MAKRKSELDLAIIHLTIEGIAASGGGVCTVTRGHLATLPRVKKALAKERIKLTPYFVETHFGPGYDNYDPDFLVHAKGEIEKMGGKFYSVLNSSPDGMPISCNWPGGEDFFGTIEQIKLESAGAASIARSIGRRHDASVVYCHDTFFMLSPVYGTLQDNDESMQWLRVVHSTTLKHDKEPVDPGKIGAEFAGFYWARQFPNVHIGAISDPKDSLLTALLKQTFIASYAFSFSLALFLVVFGLAIYLSSLLISRFVAPRELYINGERIGTLAQLIAKQQGS